MPAGAARRLRRQLARGVTRRDILRYGAAATGAALGAPLLSACGDSASTPGADGTVPVSAVERRTMFFNLAHEDTERTSHFLVMGGRRHELVKVRDQPHVLARARQANGFLRAVPDDQVTHHVEDIELSTDISSVGFIGGNEDPATGTWTLSMVVQYLPSTAVAHAFAQARARAAGGALPLSAKRHFYGHPPAALAQDLHDEQALVDSTDHARTLIGLHPDLLCADPDGAQHIHVNHILPNANTRFLAAVLRTKGPAAPQQTPNQPNATGWATLVPINQDDGQPFKNTKGLNQYLPDWHPDVDARVATGIDAIHRQVKDDATLGADLTGVAPPADPPASLAGKVWYRRDGVTTVDHGAAAAPSAVDAPRIGFRQIHGEAGLFIDQPTGSARGDGRVLITLPLIQNWFLRFLGIWVQFVDPNGKVIPVSQLPPDTIPGESVIQRGLSKANTLFLGLLPPAYTVAGVPVGPGFVSPSFVMPADAASAKFLLAGLGLNGSWHDPDEIILVGAAMTMVVNMLVVIIFMAAGVIGLGDTMKTIAAVASGVVVEIAAFISGLFTFRDKAPTAASIMSLVGRLVQGILAAFAGKGMVKLVQAITTKMVAAQIIDNAPVVGQIARAAAAAIGALQLAQTGIEIGVSPPIYEFDLSLTHDLSVNILPDPNNNAFPQLPPGYTLYYKVTYLFDNGTPHVLDGVVVPDPTVKSIAVTLTGIPRGGQVNVSVGFYARSSSTAASQNDWCAGKGTTGLVSNDVDQAPDLVIQQIKVPIDRTTRYLHTRKTQLDAQGRHAWVSTAAAPAFVPPSGGQQPGDLGAFRDITVRQGTATQAGYVGYAWQAFSRGLLDCTANAPGQLDQAANLNTDAGNQGANAQNGYVAIPCGLQGGATGGVKLAYSLLTAGGANLYLDTSTLRVRQIRLDPPEFMRPGSGQTFGQLNLDSTALLLHPAGHLVSINNANHRLEALRLPAAPFADDDASAQLLARAYSGQGARPGLMISPVAAAVSPDGVVLVLEDAGANNRIQAFDLGGNPVAFFKQQKTPYFLQLDATAGHAYLDLAVEFTGYLYVLSRDPGGSVFRLDVYHPGQTDTQPISTTQGVNAAKLAVDFWRSVYTLNYELLQLPGGAVPDRTEPSVSLWLPSLPAA